MVLVMTSSPTPPEPTTADTSTQRGWYPTPDLPAAAKRTLTYWNGSDWAGAPRRAGWFGKRVRDTWGLAAMVSAVLGVVLSHALIEWLLFAGELVKETVVAIIALGILAGLVLAICGVVAGVRRRFRVWWSLSAFLVLAFWGYWYAGFVFLTWLFSGWD